jgi:hypothetical protein
MARTFNGTSQRYDRSGIPYSAYPFTYALWIRPTAALLAGSANGVAMAGVSSGASTSGPYLRINPSNDRLEAGVSDNVGFSSPSATVAADSWAHIAAVWNSTTARTAYLNGVAGTTATTSKSFVVNNAGIRLGARQGGSGSPTEWFGGDLAEAAIWDAALAASDIAALAKGVPPLLVRPANLVFYAPLLGRSATEPEWIGATALTPSNAPPQASHPRLLSPYRGYAPRRSQANTRVAPDTGALTLSGSVPSARRIDNPHPLVPGATLALESFAPSARVTTSAAPPPAPGAWRAEGTPQTAWRGDALRPAQWQVTAPSSADWSSDP